MIKYGINVSKGVAAPSIEEVKEAVKSVFPSGKEVVVKSHILAGGRGLGTFKSGLKGGVHNVKTEEVADFADKGCIYSLPLSSYYIHLFSSSLLLTYGTTYMYLFCT
ncbi:hypothetical protein BHE74_00056483 [Ensete ventricosum]|nr:hypothetical protein BHE74_00056483 [Ensete ventricosum]RZR88310.1 hypothetical protein BHM03_00015859 [Ensete ventricosum]